MFTLSVTYQDLQQRLRQQELQQFVRSLHASIVSTDVQLLRKEQVPSVYWEVGIHTRYRKPESSWSECIRSAFHPTNETLNFWTHFIPFLYFMYQLQNFVADEAFVSDSYHWPFLAFLTTVCWWPLVSCFAHLFSVMSPEARQICFFVDYMSLSWYSFGVACCYHAYCFDSLFFNTWYSRIFLAQAAVATLLCTTLSCQSRMMGASKRKKLLRIIAFVLPYTCVSAPLIERLVHCYWRACDDAAVPLHLGQFALAASGILIYGVHFPESVIPGRFDFFGHSHQIFHVCGILATYSQVRACYADMQTRRALFTAENALPSGRADLSWVLYVLVANLAVVLFYSARVYRRAARRRPHRMHVEGTSSVCRSSSSGSFTFESDDWTVEASGSAQPPDDDEDEETSDATVWNHVKVD